ncbi:DUF3298 and DUF4163 domain-containing protein [Paenibacillus eucommiae]|uniref:DUF3298 domain-containing protein n=1 Tax=Paenibacillus eucommiae TaxID=1355755 RepID=A0ABS4J1N7_9BACL|nr:DUF3298 and DUF4163 domain-containing protein [Paenibacillus eucommiae]MBP1993705.1 hypothetical protein [Paenibacillus eucommiae]
MDNKLGQLKKQYMDVPIPAELDFIVKNALKQSVQSKQNKQSFKKSLSFKWIVGTGVAAVIFVTGINSSPVIANAFAGIPVVGSIVKVLTFREYKIDDQTYNAHLKVPAIANLENKELEQLLNQKYLQENKQLYQEFITEMESLKQDGGGHLGVDSGYEVKTDNESVLSIGRYVVNTVGSSSTTMSYDTIDKKNQILLTLPSLFKDDQYINIINHFVKEQMVAQMKEDPDKVYWVAGAGEESPITPFETIAADQQFYINNEGKLVISFDKYEVAPGYMGIIEFVIPTEAIKDLLVSDAYIH